jgi:beta-glucosidase
LIVGAQIAGIQSNAIVSTAKHYALNAQETDRSKGNFVIEEGAFRMSDLLAFQIAIERGRPGAVMCAYNLVNGIHACEHPWLLTQVLREEWGWPGYVMSDWGAVQSTATGSTPGSSRPPSTRASSTSAGSTPWPIAFCARCSPRARSTIR